MPVPAVLDVEALTAATRVDGDVNRRRFLAGAGGLAVLVVPGCGGEPQHAGPRAAARMVEHRYGSTALPREPQRIVTVGLTEQDYVLAFGLAPVGVREWFGEFPGALWPWARDTLGNAPIPAVLPVDELDYEQIAALRTDLILGLNSGLTQQEYDTLSGIAPTVAQHRDYADYGAPWQEITRLVGRALDREGRAEELIAPIERRLQQARARNPEFTAATAVLASSIDGTAYVYAEGPAPRFLTSLGLRLPTPLDELFTGDDRAPVQLSPERLALLDAADVLLLGLYSTPETSVVTNPVYQQLGLVREGRDITLPELSLANGALSFSSVLSLPIALDAMTPRLATALDGDPRTRVQPVRPIS